MRLLIAIALVWAMPHIAVHAQVQDSTTLHTLDSLFIAEVQDSEEPDKVLHAEPLYIDLIRDLGARRGEAEWNIAFDMTDQLLFDRYHVLVEYEWAPADRLGLEIELPMTFYSRLPNGRDALRPSNRIESIKTAIQWSFLVRQRSSLSMAVGYINQLEFSDLDAITSGPVFEGNLFNPFFVVAKRWGDNIHTLLYTGPRTFLGFRDAAWASEWEANLSLHYMITGTRNFVGVETNAIVWPHINAVIRPQMRVGIAHNLLVGIGVGIPLERAYERLGMFIRLIWEPD